MGLKSNILPDNILRLMRAEDRAQLGKAGMTAAEAAQKCEAGEERELQGDIANYLRMHGIWFDQKAMHRKSTAKKGCPDFLFCYLGMFCAVEAKTVTGKLGADQQDARAEILRNGGKHIVATSIADVQALLRSIDQERQLENL